jgi:5'-methylthioadenosine phosphorylase
VVNNLSSSFQVVLASEAGLCYAAIGLVTDYDCWRDTGSKVCVDEVMRTFRSNVRKVVALLKHVLPVIASKDWDEVIDALRVRYCPQLL